MNAFLVPTQKPQELQPLLALGAPPRRQRLRELGERLVREPRLVVQDVECVLLSVGSIPQMLMIMIHESKLFKKGMGTFYHKIIPSKELTQHCSCK